MKTVKEVSRLTGISVRTLHYYDEIGLLQPACVTEAGYRLYDDASLQRLKSILLFRTLRFPLKTIREILETPDFDPQKALEDQIQILKMQKRQLEELISHAEKIQKTGVFTLDFDVFDERCMREYSRQAKEKWGKTRAYREYEEKAEGKRSEQQKQDARELMELFEKLGKLRHLTPQSPEIREWVVQLQRTITRNYYTCTKTILRGLGAMYAAGGSMTENIDAAGGEGTALLARQAIEIYCEE